MTAREVVRRCEYHITLQTIRAECKRVNAPCSVAGLAALDVSLTMLRNSGQVSQRPKSGQSPHSVYMQPYCLWQSLPGTGSAEPAPILAPLDSGWNPGAAARLCLPNFGL